jgi:hypothetical protein
MGKKSKKIKDISKIEWDDISHKYEEEEENESNDLYQDIYGGQTEYDAERGKTVYTRRSNKPIIDRRGITAFRNEFWTRYSIDIWD